VSNRRKFQFEGSTGEKLAGLLETPDREPIATALFAHCFTCGKDIAAASRIARALVKRGYAVMRFDFTGLGGSDGDFANTNFTSNVEDLVAAAEHLRAEGMAPTLLIGHSLGGTAVLTAAHKVPECKGVVTIGSPADAQHVSHQFECDIATIEKNGEAEVNLAGRKFLIKKQFLDDINRSSVNHISKLNTAFLVMHSPIDTTVNITEAERIYRAARHPKSFVSLDDAKLDLQYPKVNSPSVSAIRNLCWMCSAILIIGLPTSPPNRVATTQGQIPTNTCSPRSVPAQQ